MTSPSKPSAVLVYAGLVLGALITLAPFALGLLTSFTSAHQFATGTPLSWPRPPTLANYADLAGAGFGRALAVTALMTAVILLGQLTFSVLAAYAFARLQFPGPGRAVLGVSRDVDGAGQVTVVPLYLMMAQLGLRNTFWALVLPFMFGSPYAIFLLREHFRAIPDDLINAALPGRRQHAGRDRARGDAVQPAGAGHADADHRRLAVEPLHVAVGDHQRHQVAGADGGDRRPAVALQRAVDAGDGGDAWRSCR